MSSTIGQTSFQPHSFERTIADLKQGVDSAKTLQAEVSEKAVQTAKSYAASNQASVAAFTQAGQILTTGSQDLFRQMAESTQSAFTEVVAGIRAVAGASTFKERIELQANLFRTSAIRAVSESSRFARGSIDLTESASAPLMARAVAAADAMALHKA